MFYWLRFFFFFFLLVVIFNNDDFYFCVDTMKNKQDTEKTDENFGLQQTQAYKILIINDLMNPVNKLPTNTRQQVKWSFV